MKNKKPFAAFVMHQQRSTGLFAATTRPYDIKNSIGLAGGSTYSGGEICDIGGDGHLIPRDRHG
jgi:hypothetical protein